ncbi:MAG: nuclear transport factor 2 family protein [Variovorax sp.]
MNAKETVTALYAAYASGDPARIGAMLHPEVIWTAPAGNATQVALGLGRPEDAGLPAGANDLGRRQIVQFMAHNFARLFSNVKNEFRAMVAEGDLVFVEHQLSGVLPNGRGYINDYCFAFQVREEQVWRIREYMDTRGGWAQVFGDAEPTPLLDYVEKD